MFFQQYESNEPIYVKIGEMTATGFGRFHVESPVSYCISLGLLNGKFMFSTDFS